MTGNVKLCCHINNGEVSSCNLNPLTTITPIIPHKINLEKSKLGVDISNFYKDYSSIFYASQIETQYLEDSMYKILVPEDILWNGNIGDCQYGLKRVSLNKNDNKQLSILAPIYIDNETDIPTHVLIQCSSMEGQILFSRSIKIDNSTSLGKYLQRSYENINGTRIASDNSNVSIKQPRIMYVAPKDEKGGEGISTLNGWSMQGGERINISSTLPQSIFSQDLTMTQFDTYICNEYRKYNIVLPHIINFCWYFNLNDLTNIDRLNISYGTQFRISVRYYKEGDTPGTAEFLPLGDLDFNHYKDNDGVLEYLQERDLPEIRSNQTLHLVPTSSIWSVCGSNNQYIFNNFVGFENSTSIKYHISVDENKADSRHNNLAWIDEIVTDSKNSSYQSSCIGSFDIDKFLEGDIFTPGIKSLYDSKTLINKYFIDSTDEDRVCFCNGLLFKPNNTDYSEYNYVSISCITNKNKISGDDVDVKTLLIKDNEDMSLNIIIWLPSNVDSIYDLEHGIIDNLTIKKMFLDKASKSIDYIISKTKDSVTGIYTWNAYESVTDLNIQDILGDFVEPQYIYVNKPLSSIFINNRSKRLRQNMRESNTILKRYFGWIQPHIIPVNEVTGKTSSNDYIFVKNTEANRNTNKEIYGALIAENMNDKNCNFRKYPLHELAEYKWFDASTCIYLPTHTEKIFNLSENVNKTINDCLKAIFTEMLNITDITETLYQYLLSIYRYMIDADIKKENFIIKLILK